jgi:phage gpG-like protein
MTWAIVIAAVTTAVTAVSQSRAAKAQSIELEVQAEQEKVSAEGRELQRRQELNRRLAANVVGQASSGIKGEGTPESIALASAKKVSTSEGVESLSDRLKQAQLKRQAKNIRSAGKLQAASTLLSSGAQAAQLGGG